MPQRPAFVFGRPLGDLARARLGEVHGEGAEWLRLVTLGPLAGAPETNGCAEKAIQTLKEQALWTERFETFEELRAAVRDFGRLYNREWLLERHGYRTPIEAREMLLAARDEEVSSAQVR